MLFLVITLLIDTSIVKINDLIDKKFLPIRSKLLLFSVNSLSCLLLQYVVIKYVAISFRIKLSKGIKASRFYVVSFASLCLSSTLIGILILQQFYNSYYDNSIIISIIVVSYGTAAALIIWLSFLFFSWYRSSHKLIVFLYFASMLIIAFSLIATASYIGAKISDRAPRAVEYVGASGDVSGGRYLMLNNIYKISSFMSFFSIWITTAILMKTYGEKLISSIAYWTLLSLPLVYFLVTYFYQYILSNVLISYLEIDPITVSIVLSTFLSLSKPIGGLIFGAAFWNISKIISYDINIRTSMIIAGWGIFLIFSANQAATLITGPYPPFGVTTITVLNIAAYLTLLGIYNSATLASRNENLRKFIHKQAVELKLLGFIGRAEMEKEIQKTIRKIEHDDSLVKDKDHPVELDVKELKKYIDLVTK